eukprot:Skav220276  [mRNA]  locus=scaffold915:16715:18583:+ [translate_table: standard]
MKHFFSTQRLQQHLKYRSRRTGRNACYQQLCKQGYSVDYIVEQIPREFTGYPRVDSLQAEGPLRLTSTWMHREAQELQTQLGECERRLQDLDLCSCPPDYLQKKIAALTAATWAWFHRYVQGGYSLDPEDELPDVWLGAFADIDSAPDMDRYDAAILLHWGQNHLPEVYADFQDGEAEWVADAAFADLVAGLPLEDDQRLRVRLLARITYLTDLEDCDVPHRPHEALRPVPGAGRLQRGDAVLRLYGQQDQWLAQLRAVKWRDLPGLTETALPIYKQISTRPVLLICHLFSGRRRPHDFHHWMTEWGQRRGVQVVLISADTAISEYYGDLSPQAAAGQAIHDLYAHNVVAATLCGPPCETFSEARHNQPESAEDTAGPAEAASSETSANGGLHPPRALRPGGAQPGDHGAPGAQRRWPRPLRSKARIIGLELLTAKEMRQLRMGSFFLFSMLVHLAQHVSSSGLFIIDHPGPPSQEDRASTWSTALVALLLQHPEVALHVLGQWRWGSPSAKPTGFLTLRLPRFRASMFSRTTAGAQYPSRECIGVGPDGRFLTAALKEYSTDLCKALAGAFTDQIERSLQDGHLKLAAQLPESLTRWVSEASTDAAVIRDNCSFRPDYQGG